MIIYLSGHISTVFALDMVCVLLSSWLEYTRLPTLCLWQQTNNVTYRKRVSADQVSWWTSGAPFCREDSVSWLRRLGN